MRPVHKFKLAMSAVGLMSIALAIALPVSAQQQGAPAQHDMMGGQSGAPRMGQMADAPAGQAMMQAMDKMHKDMMSAPPSGNADQDFVSMMTPHHQGAIDMARIELQYGKDPTLRRMAQAIIAAQEKEIHAMQQWKSKHPASL